MPLSGRDVARRFWDATNRQLGHYRPAVARVQAYRDVFMVNGQVTMAGERALKAMADYAGMDKGLDQSALCADGRVDPFRAGVMEGRRQMVLAIAEAVNMNSLQLHHLLAELEIREN
jgi:hypothetical protein